MRVCRVPWPRVSTFQRVMEQAERRDSDRSSIDVAISEWLAGLVRFLAPFRLVLASPFLALPRNGDYIAPQLAVGFSLRIGTRRVHQSIDRELAFQCP